MARHNLSKPTPLDITHADGQSSPVPPRFASILLLALNLARATTAGAQPAIVSDLWRVAAGTLVIPAALAEDGSTALWTPAAVLPPGAPAMRVGIETVHSPSEIGVNGGVATVAFRAGKIGTVNLLYGRMGVDGLVRTETSPEAIGGDIAAYSEVLSAGVARAIGAGFTAGIAARALSGRLDVATRSQLGLDLGVRYTDATRFSFGLATRFFDPSLRGAESAASYSAAASWRTGETPLWGTTAVLALWYGAGWSHGEGMQHLVSAGVIFGGIAELDLGTAREETTGFPVWRSRLGVSLDVGHYRIYLGRDGGVNSFGATYRFGLTARML